MDSRERGRMPNPKNGKSRFFAALCRNSTRKSFRFSIGSLVEFLPIMGSRMAVNAQNDMCLKSALHGKKLAK
jgi:hypothetical protein